MGSSCRGAAASTKKGNLRAAARRKPAVTCREEGLVAPSVWRAGGRLKSAAGGTPSFFFCFSFFPSQAPPSEQRRASMPPNRDSGSRVSSPSLGGGGCAPTHVRNSEYLLHQTPQSARPPLRGRSGQDGSAREGPASLDVRKIGIRNSRAPLAPPSPLQPPVGRGGGLRTAGWGGSLWEAIAKIVC